MSLVFDPPLIRGQLIKRYQRFLADIQLDDGTLVTSHCANSGSMLGVKQTESWVWVQPLTHPSGKLRYRWELIEVEGQKVCINTLRPNQLMKKALAERAVPELGDYIAHAAEVKYGGGSRADFVLEYPDGTKGFVEVKSAHLRFQDIASFPDSVTQRGTKHLVELMRAVDEGHKAFVVFLVQRGDCSFFQAAQHIDAVFADTLVLAARRGVQVLAFLENVQVEKLEIARKIPILGL